MLVKNESADRKLASPNNLINSLRDRKNAMSLFIRPASPITASQIEKPQESFNPFDNPARTAVIEKIEIPKEANPQINDLMQEADVQVKLGLAHNSALDVLSKAVKRLGEEVDSIPAGKLPAVITATSKVVEGIRKERLERDKIGKDKDVHYHFYTPQQRVLTDYDVIDVTP